MKYLSGLGYSGVGPRNYKPSEFFSSIPPFQMGDLENLKAVKDSYERDIQAITDKGTKGKKAGGSALDFLRTEDGRLQTELHKLMSPQRCFY